MSRLFSKKFRLSAGLATLLCVGLGSNHLYAQSTNEQVNQQQQPVQNVALNQKAETLTQPFLSLPFIQSVQLIATNLLNFVNDDQGIEQNLISAATPYKAIDELKKFKFNVNPSQVFNSGKLPSTKIKLNQADLLTVLTNTRKYYQDHANADPDVLRKGILESQGVTVDDVIKTLDFMVAVLKEDIANNRPTRLQDPNFINKNFKVIKWTAYNPKVKNQRQLRITKYAVFIHNGTRKKTAKYNIPIYSLNDNFTADKFYTRYTKQDVLSGIYEPGGKEFGKVEPLAYLTRTGLEEALMQGTILIKFPDGKEGYFNVDRSNEIPYVRGLKATAQKRYWYFREVNAIKGYGYNIDAKISIKPGVTFAGDVLNIGLGKVIVIEHNTGGSKQLQMGVIADTGGAFLPNLYQLDFLAGIFPSQKAFVNHISKLPEYATAYILVKK
ncbi:hypothetical protein H6G33_22180 [Calothrix sp. FACHB-1219]|uniref:hypothetical protein n=1 Tax=unclassified Calothrix TaxID=2619626 RepID=UPI001686F789|nr:MULTISPECIES: hypothetical protein [unclassified Calothrix]MBD2206740.1 hypothetical protein [Calothrix sp. FACHB-168]MBD2219730.1 hypothetical protein [Calothrix sp. FACHB-1219]